MPAASRINLTPDHVVPFLALLWRTRPRKAISPANACPEPRAGLTVHFILVCLCYPEGHMVGGVVASDLKAAGGSEPTAQIFISYSRRDMAFTDRLEAALKQRGF